MIEEIKTWLNTGRNYTIGVKLYDQYGKDKKLKAVFNEEVSEFKKKALFEALKKLLSGKHQMDDKVEKTKGEAIEHISLSQSKWPAQKDEVLGALQAKWRPLFSEMMNLCSRIYDVAKLGEIDSGQKDAAGRMAHRILDLDDQCDEIYDQRDYYLEHKCLPESEKLMSLVVDPKKIPLALQNAERYIRDYRNRLKINPENVNAANQLKKWEWARDEYKKILCL